MNRHVKQICVHNLLVFHANGTYIIDFVKALGMVNRYKLAYILVNNCIPYQIIIFKWFFVCACADDDEEIST